MKPSPLPISSKLLAYVIINLNTYTLEVFKLLYLCCFSNFTTYTLDVLK